MPAQNLGSIINGISNNMANRSHGIPTGFTKLDEALYGLHSELIVVGGRPSMGKSSFIADLAINVSSVAPVLIFSLEMSHIMLSERMLANMSEIPLGTLMDGKVKPELEKRRKRALLCLQNRDIVIDDDCALTPAKISERIGVFCNKVVLPTMQSSKYKKSRGAVFIDYLQLMKPTNKTGMRYQDIDQMVIELHELVKAYDIPIILASQLKRFDETRKDNEPRLSDLRESGGIEQSADVVLLLHRPSYYKMKEIDIDTVDDGEAYVFIAKNRQGPTGKVPLVWIPEFMGFRDIGAWADDADAKLDDEPFAPNAIEGTLLPETIDTDQITQPMPELANVETTEPPASAPTTEKSFEETYSIPKVDDNQLEYKTDEPIPSYPDDELPF